MPTTSWREKSYLKTKEIAEILDIHPNTAYELIQKLPHIKVGTIYRVPVQAFEKWLRDQERSCTTCR